MRSGSNILGIDKEIIKRIAGFKEDGDNVIMSPQNYENFLKFAYLYYPNIRIGGDMRRMVLSKDGLLFIVNGGNDEAVLDYCLFVNFHLL